uniref:Uncharacterized protein n=1 Tax=Leersia perrieri TaxID=77586 RepID=A0A0D9WD26_9ORYZ
MSRSIVSISSPPPEGKLLDQHTGIVIRWDGANKRAMLCIHLPNKSNVPTFRYDVKYGQEILILCRNEKKSLEARRGTILWADGSSSWRNHYIVDCDGGVGGLVVHKDGSSIAMLYGSLAPIISMSTALSCIEMWEQFRCVARPVFKMNLATVELLGVSIREGLSIKHNITDGFIVKHVGEDSDLERLSVRIGDIDNYLQALGWKYLQGMSWKFMTLQAQLGKPLPYP